MWKLIWNGSEYLFPQLPVNLSAPADPNTNKCIISDCDGNTSVTAGDAQMIFRTVLGQACCVDPITLKRDNNDN